MNKSTRKTLIAAGITAAALLGANLFIMLKNLPAEEAEKKTVQYNLNMSLGDNLSACTGAHVRVTLSSGTMLSGTVKQVKNHLLHLEKLSGRDYFDALIKLNDISAMDTKFRGF